MQFKVALFAYGIVLDQVSQTKLEVPVFVTVQFPEFVALLPAVSNFSLCAVETENDDKNSQQTITKTNVTCANILHLIYKETPASIARNPFSNLSALAFPR